MINVSKIKRELYLTTLKQAELTFFIRLLNSTRSLMQLYLCKIFSQLPWARRT